MNKFKRIKYLGMSVVLTPIAFIVIGVVMFFNYNWHQSHKTVDYNANETHYDTVEVRKVVVDTVKVKVYEKVPTPKTETTSDSL